MELERLDKILSNNGCGSRKDVKKLIKSGAVLVDDLVIKTSDAKVDVKAKFKVNGITLAMSKYIYILMNKPKGVLSATTDTKSQTVLDLIPKEYVRAGLFPVGRLDKDTTGLLLITNDGELAHLLLSPKKHVDKEYYIECDKPFLEDEITLFADGIKINTDYICKKAILKIDENKNGFLTITEGKFHQVKKMCLSLGKEVINLKRISMGPLVLDEELQQGQVRLLMPLEIEMLERYKK